MKVFKRFLPLIFIIPACGGQTNPNSNSSFNLPNSSSHLGVDLNPDNVTYANNVLTTPLFKLIYDDLAGKSYERKNHQWKENFLQKQYALFLEHTTFSNEVYTLQKVIFRLRKSDGSQKHTGGSYVKETRILNVYFDYEDDETDVFSIFSHEYYHHLATWRGEQIFFSAYEYNPLLTFQKKEDAPNDADYDSTKDEAFFQLINGGFNRVQTNWYQPQKDFPYLQGLTYEYETKQYFDNYFSKNQPHQLITFPKNNLFDILEKGKNNQGHFLITYLSYMNNLNEHWAQAINTYTTKQKKAANNLVELNRFETPFYLMHLFLKTNIYYSYGNLNRKYPPKFINQEGRSWIEDKDQLKWSQVYDFKEQTPDAMRQKYQEWKDYFENILFNQDQLLANAFIDNSNNLFMELNQKEQTLTFENIVTKKIVSPPITKLGNYGQVTFNLKPYQDGQKTKIANWAYKIAASDLPPGTYLIKVNNLPLKSHQGLDLIKRKNQSQKLFRIIPYGGTYITKLEYNFFIEDGNILLKVY